MNIHQALKTKSKTIEIEPNPEQPVGLQLIHLEELESESEPIVMAAKQLMVCDQPSLDLAGSLLTERIKPMLKEIEASCGPVVKAAHAAHKAATKQRNELTAPLLEAERILKGKMVGHLDEQARLQRVENHRIEDEQRKAHEVSQRQARESAEAETLRMAEELEAAGDSAAADAMLDAPLQVENPVAEIAPLAIATPGPDKVEGISSTVSWGAEVVDLMALVKAVAAGDAPLNLLQVDQRKLVAQIRALDGQVKYPGVRVLENRTVTARAAK